ncbi:MAG: AAA family ATPase [Oligoflexales bacterium]|nr:AAA family ATPase [Oligoflexales bacterium]
MLRGARQVGKTALVRRLAESTGLTLCEINFERMPRLRHLIDEAPDLAPGSLLPLIGALLGVEIIAERTLLFFDEIQECGQAVVALRYFFEEMPNLHVIAAGSLLEFTLSRVSIPVGRISFLYVHPMSFEEFLGATGRSTLHKQRPLLNIRQEHQELPKAIHDALRDALREYFIVGGMPACIAEYTESRSFFKVRTIQADIIQTYLADVRKYAKGDAQISNIGEVMASAFSFVGQQISYTALGDGDAIKRTKQSVRLLAQAQILHIVKATTSVEKPPLSAGASDKVFKIVFLDIGLGQQLSGVKMEDLIAAKDFIATYEGKLTEQFIGQELIASDPLSSEGLYYWRRNERGSSSEIDYLFSRDGRTLPMEIKSGPAGRLKSLHIFLEKFGGDGVCLQDSPRIGYIGNVSFIPLYARLADLGH